MTENHSVVCWSCTNIISRNNIWLGFSFCANLRNHCLFLRWKPFYLENLLTYKTNFNSINRLRTSTHYYTVVFRNSAKPKRLNYIILIAEWFCRTSSIEDLYCWPQRVTIFYYTTTPLVSSLLVYIYGRLLVPMTLKAMCVNEGFLCRLPTTFLNHGFIHLKCLVWNRLTINHPSASMHTLRQGNTLHRLYALCGTHFLAILYLVRWYDNLEPSHSIMFCYDHAWYCSFISSHSYRIQTEIINP